MFTYQGISFKNIKSLIKIIKKTFFFNFQKCAQKNIDDIKNKVLFYTHHRKHKGSFRLRPQDVYIFWKNFKSRNVCPSVCPSVSLYLNQNRTRSQQPRRTIFGHTICFIFEQFNIEYEQNRCIKKKVID